jgi:7-carboxy-7-deazaguanine synthase
VTYTVKEIFYTLQGEGANMGKPAVFIRFAGCNLWSGREEDRANATCRFCDTDFVGGTRYSAAALARAAAELWPVGAAGRFTVLTGGEPLLQVDAPLLAELKLNGFRIAIETNGTQTVPPGLDWICVSPKAGAPVVITEANEVKLVFPQSGMMPGDIPPIRAMHHWLSPMDGPDLIVNMGRAAAWCLEHPEWRLNIQAHKVWNIP